MGIVALALAALAAWLIWTGRLQRMRAKDGMALGVALVGAVLAAKGKPVIGAPLLIGATMFFVAQGRQRGKRRTPPGQAVGEQDIARARALLGVSADADAEAIRAAHRRLIASVHPDKGGSEALAAQINAARDTLLAVEKERDQAPLN